MAFAGVGLLATAAATWILGSNLGHDEGIGVTVDTVRNESARFDLVSLSDKEIHLGEKRGEEAASSGVIHNDNLGGVEDLQITFSSLSFSFGESFVKEGQHLEIQFMFEYGEKLEEGENRTSLSSTDRALNQANLVTSNHIGASRNEAQTVDTDNAGGNDAWEYVSAPAAVSFEDVSFDDLASNSSDLSASTGQTFQFSSDSNTGMISGSIKTNLSISFSWGSFFGGKSPVEYYNSKFYNYGDTNTEGKTEVNASIEAAMYQELNEMNAAFAGGGLVLTMRLASVAN